MVDKKKIIVNFCSAVFVVLSSSIALFDGYRKIPCITSGVSSNRETVCPKWEFVGYHEGL